MPSKNNYLLFFILDHYLTMRNKKPVERSGLPLTHVEDFHGFVSLGAVGINSRC